MTTATEQPIETLSDSEVDYLIDEQICQEAEARAVETAEGRVPLDDDGDPFDDTEPFSINTEDKANWYLKTRRNYETEIATIKAQADAMIRSIEHNLTRLNTRFEPELAAWTTAEIERRGGKAKSIKLFQGTVAWRHVGGGVKVADIEEAMRYAREKQLATFQLDASAYRKLAQEALGETGEVLPGVEITPERESFSVRFPGAKGQQDGED